MTATDTITDATDTITDATVTTAPPPCGWPSCDHPAAWIGRMRGPCRHTLLRCNRHHARAVALEALNRTYHHPGCDSRAQFPIKWRPL